MSAPQALRAATPAAGRGSGRRLNPSLVVGGVLVLVVVVMALVSFVWTPYDPTLVDPTSRLLTPSAQHWLGTDKFGRDVLSQIMVGSRTTLFVGFVAVGVAAVIGVPLGILAAMAPRWVGEVTMRGNDLLLAFPRCCWRSCSARSSAPARSPRWSPSASPPCPASRGSCAAAACR